MAYQGKTRLTYVIVSPPDAVAEGDRIFASHATWMAGTHHRSGPKTLHTYDVSKSMELSNPFDPDSEPTGNTCFVLNEIYETDEGVSDHFRMGVDGWEDFPALVEWLGRCNVSGAPAGRIFNSLW